jgi:tRNA A-37 threonylcarbamoyl transferase component Bud32
VADLVGKKLKDFYVMRRLGRGAMAEVYLAQQQSLGRQIALKVLNADLARDPNYVRRFHHEARAAAALVHAGIVQIYEVGEENGIHFIAQEYVAGRNVGEVIRSHGSLEPPLVLDILRQVAAALTKASSEGIVHRDIKPENIMLAGSGEVKVADFGLARVMGDGGANLTQVGVAMGTPLYMSPEQIEGKQIDSRSDIYSLGVSAYHMLAGEPPFTGDSPLTVAVQHLNQAATPLTARQPNLPPPLVGAVGRMMAKKPADRFSDPAALLGELNAIAADGIQQGWAAKSRVGSIAEILGAVDKRAVTTARLDELMKTTALAQQRRSPTFWAPALLGCVLLGVAGAAISRPANLLSQAASGPAESDDVEGQLYHAKMVDTEAAWLAVAEYFPQAGEYSHNLAREGLVHFYLSRTPDYEKALRPAQQVADAAQPEFQTFGLAALVVAYAHLGDDESAYDANGRLSTEMRASLAQEAPEMSRLLNEALDLLADRAQYGPRF